jgi:hypothetical protein
MDCPPTPSCPPNTRTTISRFDKSDLTRSLGGFNQRKQHSDDCLSRLLSARMRAFLLATSAGQRARLMLPTGMLSRRRVSCDVEVGRFRGIRREL